MGNFHKAVEADASQQPSITIGGDVFYVKPASQASAQEAIARAFQWAQRTLVTLENDNEPFFPSGDTDQKNVEVSRAVGFRIHTQRNYRVFVKGFSELEKFCNIFCILTFDGKLAAADDESLDEILLLLDRNPKLLDEAREIAKWDEFFKATSEAAKALPESKKEGDNGQDVPNA